MKLFNCFVRIGGGGIKFCNLTQLLSTLTAIVFFQINAFSQCSDLAVWHLEIQNNTLRLVPNALDNNVAYTWTWGTNTSNSPILELPFPTTLPFSQVFTLNIITIDNCMGQYATTVTVTAQNCEAAGFNFVTETGNGCVGQFVWPFIPAGNQVWNFGDGTPEDYTNAQPFHAYATSGNYVVSHYLIDFFSLTGYSVVFCKKNVSTQCEWSPADATFICREELDCCELELVCTSKNESPDCTHTWAFGPSIPDPTSTGPLIVHHVNNVSTYPNGTPTIKVYHSITCGGMTVTQSKEFTFTHLGIFVGKDGQTTETKGLTSAISPYSYLISDFANASLNNINLFVSGDLKVSHKKLTIYNSDVCMDADASIQVSGSTFFSPTNPIPQLERSILKLVQGTEVHNRDRCMMWRNIMVGNLGTLETYGGVTIKDAMVAINTKRENDPESGPPPPPSVVLRLKSTTFDHNFIDIMYRDKDPGIEVFSNYDFINSDKTLPLKNASAGTKAILDYMGLSLVFNPANTYAGILVNKSQLLLPQSTQLLNDFSDIANGIILVNSDVPLTDVNHVNIGSPIRWCRFKNIVQLPTFPGISGRSIHFIDNAAPKNTFYQLGNGVALSDPYTFFDCFEAIKIENGAALQSSIDCGNNRMVNVNYGINLDIHGGLGFPGLATRSQIRNNRITCKNAGIYLVSQGSDVVGLLCEDNWITVQGLSGRGTSFQHNGAISDHPNALFLRHNLPLPPDLAYDIQVTKGNRGVFLQNFKGANIQNQSINIGNNNVADATDIDMRGCSGTKVTGCYLSGNNYLGITQDMNNMNFFENVSYMDNLRVGLQVSGANPSEIKCNRFIANKIGLYLKGVDANVGEQKDKGNTWEGNYPTGRWKAKSEAQFATASKFTTFNDATHCPLPSVQVAAGNLPSDLFDCEGPIVTCNFSTTDPNTSPLDIIYGMERVFAGNGYDLGVYSDKYNWNGRRYAYAHFDAKPSLLNNEPALQAFMTANTNTTLGKLHSSAKQIDSLYIMSGSQSSTLNLYFYRIAAAVKEMAEIDSLLGGAPSNGTLLEAQRAALQDTIIKYKGFSETIYNNYWVERKARADAAYAKNNAIVTSTVAQANEKTLNGIFLRTIGKKVWPTQAERNAIRDIGLQCPLDGGPAVYWARVWHETLTGEELQGSTDCVGPRSEEMDEEQILTSSDGQFSAYPNPASQILHVSHLQGGFVEGSTVALFNALGQMQQDLHVMGNTNEIVLDVQGLLSGVYLLRLSLPGQKAETLKVLIINQ